MTDSPSITAKDWLHGAILSEAAALAVVVANVMKRRAHLQVQEKDARLKATQEILPSEVWHIGSVLIYVAFILAGSARLWAPGMTVVLAQALAIVINAVASAAILTETFKIRDVLGTVIVIVCAFGAVASQTPEHMLPRPSDQISVKQAFPMSENTGFVALGSALLMLVAGCLVANCALRCSMCNIMKRDPERDLSVQRFTLPFLSGFFFAVVQDLMCVLISTVTNNGHLTVASSGALTWSLDATDWTDLGTLKSALLVLVLAAIFAIGSIGHFSYGSQVLECRYFTTASIAICMATMSVADVMFSRKWEAMTPLSIIAFCLTNCGSVLGALYVSPRDTSPQKTMREAYEAQPLLKSAPAQSKLDVVPVTPTPEHYTCWYNAWVAFGRWLPLFIIVQSPILYSILLLLHINGHTWFVFTLLTIYSCWSTYHYGLHLLIFSIGGRRHIQLAQQTDFRQKFETERAERREKQFQSSQSEGSMLSPTDEEADWEDILHFAIIANYKEHLHIIQEAVSSVAASPLAKKQIVLVLACEERENGCREKAETVAQQFQDQFRDVLPTYHPPDLPGEMPSKASNMHWATARINDYVKKLPNVSPHHVLVTVADADSDFHSKHFCALTETFLSAGPDRFENIWQPLMLHYKNYHEQPATLRLASQLTAQYELAHLADPMAISFPYSTYSIPLILLQSVGDFDPDWVSEDWHIGLKCRLATCGKCCVRPIFLPVINYTPEDETYLKTLDARWQQAKRHALGFTEIGYVWNSIPLAYAHFAGNHRCSRLCTFFGQAVAPLVFKIMCVHGIVCSMFLLGPLNAYMVYHFWVTGADSCIGSWTYMIDFTVTSCNAMFHFGALLSGIFLYEMQKHRIVPHPDGELFWCKYKILHFLRLVFIEYICFGPAYFLCGGAAEWVAAFQSIRSHKFSHDVALKPQQSLEQRVSLMSSAQPEQGCERGMA